MTFALLAIVLSTAPASKPVFVTEYVDCAATAQDGGGVALFANVFTNGMASVSCSAGTSVAVDSVSAKGALSCRVGDWLVTFHLNTQEGIAIRAGRKSPPLRMFCSRFFLRS